MTPNQERVLESLKRRVVRKTCHSFPAELTRAEHNDKGDGYVTFSMAADAKCFHGSLFGYLGPRGGVYVTHEAYEVY